MNRKPYSSAIKKTPYLYLISKRIASLILKKLDRNEVFEKCFNENYIEIDSEARRREIINVIYERLLCLDEFLLRQLCDGDIITSKFILVYAIAKKDTLFFNFMFEVYREALLGRKNYISLDDFAMFFESKKENDLIVSAWSNTTIEQLSIGYRNILVESGFGKRVKRNIEAQKMMIHPMVEEHLRLIGDNEYIQALLGEN